MDISDAVITPTVTIPIIIVESALISGLTPSLTDEKIFIGKVVAAGPEVNEAITRSSSESVKAKSQPEIIAGAMMGSVISRNASKAVAPRSIAASSKDISNVESREDTTTET